MFWKFRMNYTEQGWWQSSFSLELHTLAAQGSAQRHYKGKKKILPGTHLLHLGPVSQRVAINRTMDISQKSMANRVLRKLAINCNPLWNRPLGRGRQLWTKCALSRGIRTKWDSNPWPSDYKSRARTTTPQCSHILIKYIVYRTSLHSKIEKPEKRGGGGGVFFCLEQTLDHLKPQDIFFLIFRKCRKSSENTIRSSCILFWMILQCNIAQWQNSHYVHNLVAKCSGGLRTFLCFGYFLKSGSISERNMLTLACNSSIGSQSDQDILTTLTKQKYKFSFSPCTKTIHCSFESQWVVHLYFYQNHDVWPIVVLRGHMWMKDRYKILQWSQMSTVLSSSRQNCGLCFRQFYIWKVDLEENILHFAVKLIGSQTIWSSTFCNDSSLKQHLILFTHFFLLFWMSFVRLYF